MENIGFYELFMFPDATIFLFRQRADLSHVPQQRANNLQPTLCRTLMPI
jgi:hypothetical protein